MDNREAAASSFSNRSKKPSSSGPVNSWTNEAGAETASQVGELVSVHVIPRPHAELGNHFSVSA